MAFALVARAAAIPSLGDVGLQNVTAFVVLCGVGMLIVHRNLLAHVVGLLVLGTGVTLAGAVLAPTLPESSSWAPLSTRWSRPSSGLRSCARSLHATPYWTSTR